MSITEPEAAAPKPERRWFQFSLRTLLLLPVVVAIAGMLYLRIEHNRDQRKAVHELWEMGVLTAERPGDYFWHPKDSMVWHHMEGWFENFLGTHQPFAIRFRNESYSYKAEEIAAIVRRVPSIKHAFVRPGTISEVELAKLRPLFPNVEIHVGEPPPQSPPPADSTLGPRVELAGSSS